MGRWENFTRVAGIRTDAEQPSAKFSIDIPPELMEAWTGGGTIAPNIGRREALQVPAVLRCRNLIAGTLGSLPYVTVGPDKKEVPDTYLMSGNIDPDVPNSVVKAYTIEDMLFEGVAWWRVTKFGWHGYPVNAQLVPHTSVHVAQTGGLLPSQIGIDPDQTFPVVPNKSQVYIDGYPVSDREIIRFDSPNPPLLHHAARAIRACLALDMAAATYASVPMPMSLFTPKEGTVDMDDDEVQRHLDKWESARANRSTAYINGALEYKPVQPMSAQDIQLSDARAHAVLEIARAAGVDPEDLGISTTSRTYQNGQQRRLDLLDFTLGAYVSAMQDRLSMRDILPRNYATKIKLDGFLRSDTNSRFQAYQIALPLGVLTLDEVRDLEDRPNLTPAEVAAIAPKPAQAAPQPDTSNAQRVPAAQQEADVPAEQFSADDTVSVQFDTSNVAEVFTIDHERRLITGMAVPWGAVAQSGGNRWKFSPDSLRWVDASRVKLNMNHEREALIGRAVRLQSGSAGLTATFKVADTPEGQRALALAKDQILDGFSIEIDFDRENGDDYKADPSDQTVRLVSQATLRGVALTGTPAYDDARVTAVAAMKDPPRKEAVMAEAKTDTKPDFGERDDGSRIETFGEYLKDATDKMVESQKELTETFTRQVGDSLTAGIKTALEDISAPQTGPQSVRAARFSVTYEPPVYAFAGSGHSLVRDAYHAYHQRDDQAFARLKKYEQQTQEMAKLATAALESARFTPQSTSTAAAIIPPGYRPDLYVSELLKGRPLVNACARGTIDNATPFVVPVFGSGGSTADHVEGTNPTDGSLTLTTKTVSPGGISGRLTLTREIVDSSNPAIDQIALLAMREAYSQQTETKVYTLLNGASGSGGTITSGFVPSGAQAATFVGTTGTPPALIGGIRSQLAGYPFARFASPSAALMGQNATKILATAADSTGRPIFPSIGAMNTTGLASAIDQAWSVDGLPFQPAWTMTGTAAGDTQIAIWQRADFWVWESPLLSFRYEEKVGPANIELNVFGYFATALIRPVGLSGIRIT